MIGPYGWPGVNIMSPSTRHPNPDPPLPESHSSVTVVTSDMQIAKLSLHWTQLEESLGQVKLFSTSIIDPLVPQIFCLPKYVLLS